MTNQEQAARTFELAVCGCDCWFCPDCCKRKGYNLRAELVPILKTFRGIMMLTLTVDPELFPTPRDAYMHIRDERGISRLLRELDRRGHLHSRRYFYVVEFQRQTEQAHFHVLIDASFVPKQAIDDAWSKLRPKSAGEPEPNRPAFGMTRFSVRKFDGGAPHAARYATKYLVKTPDYGWPEWVMQMGKEHRVPRYGVSRGFWNRPPAPPPATRGKPRKSTPRTYAQRVEGCGELCNLFAKDPAVDAESGEIFRENRWLARLGVDASVILKLQNDPPKGARRVIITSRDARACVEAIQEAAGHPVIVMSGLTTGRPLQ